MQLSEVKQKELPFPSIIEASLRVWLKLFIPYLKIVSIFIIYSLAFLVLLLIALGSMSLEGIAVLAMAGGIALTLLSYFLFLAFVPLSEEVVSNMHPTLSYAFSVIGVSGILKLLGLAVIMIIANVILRLPLFLTNNPILMIPYLLLVLIIWVAIVVYIVFAPQAILLRGAGIIDSIKYSYYLVKDRWLSVAGVLFSLAVVNIILTMAAMGIFYFIFYMVNGSVVKEIIAAAASENHLMLIMLLMTIAKSAVIFLVLSGFVSTFISVFSVAGITVFFINLESGNAEPSSKPEGPSPLDELMVSADPADKKDDHEFTEIFKNVKEINISTRTEGETASAIAPKDREEVLRHFEPLEIQEATDPPGEVPLQNLVERIDDYPTNPIPGFQQRVPPAVKDGDPGKMPTLDITIRNRSANHGLPSVHKPKSEND